MWTSLRGPHSVYHSCATQLLYNSNINEVFYYVFHCLRHKIKKAWQIDEDDMLHLFSFPFSWCFCPSFSPFLLPFCGTKSPKGVPDVGRSSKFFLLLLQTHSLPMLSGTCRAKRRTQIWKTRHLILTEWNSTGLWVLQTELWAGEDAVHLTVSHHPGTAVHPLYVSCCAGCWGRFWWL